MFCMTPLKTDAAAASGMVGKCCLASAAAMPPFCMPTSMLTHWTRDRTRGERLPVEFAVNRYTRAPAQLLGLNDRGLIAPGMKADINLIDHANLYLSPPSIVHDLPAGGRRLMQTAKGYVATIASGFSTAQSS